MNDVLKAIAQRFSCRNFTGQIPKEEDLAAIAQAAIQSPSGMNRQGWQVIIVKDKCLLDEMEAEGMRVLSSFSDPSIYQRIMDRGGKLFYNAPCMIVLAVKEADPKGAEQFDCGITAQNIVLAAESLGLASLHCGLAVLAFAASKADEFKRRLKFPEGYECGIGVLLGYAKSKAAPHTPNQDKITVIG